MDELVNSVNFIKFDRFDLNEAKDLFSDKKIEEYAQTMKDINQFMENDPKNSEKTNLSYMISETLNELEYMCMYITSKVADGKYIYNSLHQQFLKSVTYLYISISMINIKSKDKYYTNIIKVYNSWKDKDIKAEKKENKRRYKNDPRPPTT